jgi:endonuclease/exonuclease/phosphatase family metal-dependent hydrolase
MVIGGDWNSYRDKETDIYREYELKNCEPQDNYLNDFLETILSNKNIYLHDLMVVSKLTPYDNYTYPKNKFAFRSILDRVFTTIDSSHCDQTSVLDWGSNYSDHWPVLISVNLHSLCTGWLEFPQTQVTPPRITINVDKQ